MLFQESAALLKKIKQWQGQSIAMATVIATWNSSPRPVGARLVVNENGDFEGSVSGGCIEKEVIFTAINECLTKNTCSVLTFDVGDEQAWQSGLTCGGKIEILVAPLSIHSIDTMNQIQIHSKNRLPSTLMTDLKTGEMELNTTAVLSHQATLSQNKCYLVEPLLPRRQLLIIGGTHIAQNLAPLACACDFDVVIIDPRRAWANLERFPNTSIDSRWPMEALPEFQIDSQTAIITLTHDTKFDDESLAFALTTKAGYIGALGSKKTHAKRLQRLSEARSDKALYHRIHAPIGLAINAKSQMEIAVSIMAQIIQTLPQ